jgi:predicted SAM-dependent methyltransferase
MTENDLDLGVMKRLHLGCGMKYFDGYINIDYPRSAQTVQSKLIADHYVDIVKLQYPACSIDEVRLHHVFEHFPRQIALALLCRWTDWLKPGGLLRIETPDVMASAWKLVSPFTSGDTRQQVVRHLFGSHEAAWAAHWDGWYKKRFALTLSALGFGNLRFIRNRWGALRNIEVLGYRGKQIYTLSDYEKIAAGLLKKSQVTYTKARFMNRIAESEREMLEIWMREWKSTYTAGHDDISLPIETN